MAWRAMQGGPLGLQGDSWRSRNQHTAMPMGHKANGVMFDPGDGQGPRHYAGLNFMITVLTMHFAHLDEEESARQLMELWSFRRRQGGTKDAYWARFAILHHRSTTANGIALSPGQQCFTLMHGVGMTNRDMWQCQITKPNCNISWFN